MEEYLKRYEGVSMESGAKSEDMQLISSKRRKVYSEHENEYSDGVEVLENSVSPAASWTSGCSKHDNESSGVGKKSLRSSDLENLYSLHEGFEPQISASINGYLRERTPTSDFVGDSEQGFTDTSIMPKRKSPPPTVRTRWRTPVQKMPSEMELEEFFWEAEKCEQKRFAEKYNYDIVKDVPLEGKYQWVRLHL